VHKPAGLRVGCAERAPDSVVSLVPVEEVGVDLEGDGGVAVAEHARYGDRVESVGDEPGGCCVAEVVEADAFDAGFFGGAFEAAVGDVAVLEGCAFAGGEDRILVLGVRACEAEVDQFAAEVVGEGDAADAGRGLGRAVLAADQPLAANVEEAGGLVEVTRSFSASASVTSSSFTPLRASANVMRTVAPFPSGISAPDISETRIVFRAISFALQSG
jgi:hypothetical protein